MNIISSRYIVDIVLGHSHYILRSTSPPTCRNCVRQEQKSSLSVFIFIFSSDMPRKKGFFSYGRYINEFKVKFDPFSPTSASKEILLFIFFPPTRQKCACRDLLTVKYTECGLRKKLFTYYKQ